MLFAAIVNDPFAMPRAAAALEHGFGLNVTRARVVHPVFRLNPTLSAAKAALAFLERDFRP
jgi:hypothetical protein